MPIARFRGRCHYCGHDHDSEMEMFRLIVKKPMSVATSEPEIQAVLKEMAWGQDCRDDAIRLLRAIQNAAPPAEPK